MATSQLGPASTDTSRDEEAIRRCQPMPLQHQLDDHGRDMHPQKFVRLVGCHDAHPPPAKRVQ